VSEVEKRARSDATLPGEGPPRKGIERRPQPRYEFVVPVLVRVMLEEETFHSLPFPGRSRNIAAGGMLVEIEGISENDYKRMIRHNRFVRVHVPISEAGREAVFFGKMVWFDFRRTSKGILCRTDIAFEPLREKEQTMLTELLRQLEAAARNQPKQGAG